MEGVNARVYTFIPESADSKGSNLGSNPQIYRGIEKELTSRAGDIEEVHLALYLFNNELLFNTLKSIARKSRVVVTSLPLTGYDSRKIDSAMQIYTKLVNNEGYDLNLLIYPHMYMWYGAEYAGGGASYSFHIKAGYILYKDGSTKLILTSCNLAPGDPFHSETAVAMEDPSGSTPYSLAFKKFFEEVERLAVRWQLYHNRTRGLPDHLKRVFDFAFIGKHGLRDWSGSSAKKAFFTGPFITINGKGSTWYAREKIVELVKSADERLLVVAQHIHDIEPFNGYSGETLISAIIKKKRDNPSLEVKVLKQVPSRGLADKRRAAFVECHLSYAGVEQKANKLVHDKFIVADNTVLITTSNFTATQFGWGERNMEFTVDSDYGTVASVVSNALSLFNHPQGLIRVRPVRPRKSGSRKTRTKIIKTDTFAEVNGFVVIEDEELANILAKYFYSLWNHKLSESIEILR